MKDYFYNFLKFFITGIVLVGLVIFIVLSIAETFVQTSLRFGPIVGIAAAVIVIVFWISAGAALEKL
jgi:hypothetical protein